MHYNKESNLTQDLAVRESEQYHRVMAVIDQMFRTGVMSHAGGNCIAISEILQHLLTENSVRSRLVECKLMITETRNGQLVDFKYVGWDGGYYNRVPDAVDTHMVVITEGAQPLLIDLSVPHVLPPGRQFICEPVNSLDPEVIAEWSWGSVKIRYDIKKNPRLLGLHQTSLLERLREQNHLSRTVSWMKIAVITVMVFTALNLVLNASQLLFRLDLIDNLETINQRHGTVPK